MKAVLACAHEELRCEVEPCHASAGASSGERDDVGSTTDVLLASIGAIAIPGLGPFIAAGPLLAALSGAAAGATVGSVPARSWAFGVPEIEAKRFEGKVNGGSILLSVHTETSAEVRRAEQIMKAARAADICSTTEASVPSSRHAHAQT